MNILYEESEGDLLLARLTQHDNGDMTEYLYEQGEDSLAVSVKLTTEGIIIEAFRGGYPVNGSHAMWDDVLMNAIAKGTVT